MNNFAAGKTLSEQHSGKVDQTKKTLTEFLSNTSTALSQNPKLEPACKSAEISRNLFPYQRYLVSISDIWFQLFPLSD